MVCIENKFNMLFCYTNRGISYLNMGREQEYLQDCNKALEIDSKHLTVYLNRALYYKNKKAMDKARKDMQKAYSISPKDERVQQLAKMLK